MKTMPFRLCVLTRWSEAKWRCDITFAWWHHVGARFRKPAAAEATSLAAVFEAYNLFYQAVKRVSSRKFVS